MKNSDFRENQSEISVGSYAERARIPVCGDHVIVVEVNEEDDRILESTVLWDYLPVGTRGLVRAISSYHGLDVAWVDALEIEEDRRYPKSSPFTFREIGPFDTY